MSEHELKLAEQQDAIDRAILRGDPPPPAPPETDLSAATRKQILATIEGKSHSQLSKLFTETNARLLSGTSNFYGFDKSMVEVLEPELARAKLRELHVELKERGDAARRAAEG